jgi:hypothetical protein
MQEYLFGPWKIAADEVFVTSPHCFAFGERHNPAHRVLRMCGLSPIPLPAWPEQHHDRAACSEP